MSVLRPTLICAALAASAACVADPLDFYVGAGVGQSVLKQDPYQIDAHVTGWKLMAGWRPISVLGAEIEYADLGSKSVSYGGSANVTQASTKAHATALYGVGYLPVPLPILDLYAKAGVARVQQNSNATPACQLCLTLVPAAQSSTNTGFAWGVGAQLKFGLPGVKLEYERFNGSQGDSSLLSLAITANF